MSRTVNIIDEIIVVSHGEEDTGKMAMLGANGKFHPSVIPVIDDLQNQITKEVAARTDADKQLQVNLDAEVLARTNADAKLQGNIDAEANARIVADSDLQDKVAAEVVNRTNVDNQLQVNIDTEIAARTAANKDLQDQVAKEIADRADADNVLQANIDTEANSRATTDKDLQEQLTKEIAARTDSDTTLQSNIDVEVVARAAADGKLQISINTEVDARTKSDQGLQDEITKEAAIRSEADKQLQANIDNAKTEANSYTDTKVAGLVNDAPGALDTLKELADALGDDSNFATTVTNQLALKADKSQIPTSLPANGGNADTATKAISADSATTAASCTGNAATAKKLETAIKINGVAFDGSADITITTGIVPIGSIVMWSGSIASIPSQWALCNGSNSTPDLRDKFVLGAGNSYSVGATGGEATHMLTVAEMPAHTHTTTFIRDQCSGISGNAVYGDENRDGTNDVTSQSTGGGGTHNNLPPYYALAYIMRIA